MHTSTAAHQHSSTAAHQYTSTPAMFTAPCILYHPCVWPWIEIIAYSNISPWKIAFRFARTIICPIFFYGATKRSELALFSELIPKMGVT